MRPPSPARRAPRARALASFGAALRRAAVSLAGQISPLALGRRADPPRPARARPPRSRAGRAPTGSARRAPAPPPPCRRACARAGRSRRAAASTSSSRSRIGVEPAPDSARSSPPRSSASIRSAAQPLGQRVELGVGARDGVGQPLGLGEQLRRAAARRQRARAPRLPPPPPRAARRPRAAASRSALSDGLLLGARVRARSISSSSNRSRSRSRSRVAGAAAQLLELGRAAHARARAPRRTRSRSARCSAPQNAVEQLELRRRHASACGARAARRTTTSRPPSSRRSAAVAERPCTYARVRPSADTRRASTISSVLAVGEALAQLGQLGRVEQPRRQLEDALDVGLLGPGPHDPRARLAAEQQVERVRQHGLARAGLPRDGVQARARAAARPARSAAGSRFAARGAASRPGLPRLRADGSGEPAVVRMPRPQCVRAGRTCRGGGGRSSRPATWASSAMSWRKRTSTRSSGPACRPCGRRSSRRPARPAERLITCEHVVGRDHQRPRR